MGTPMIAELILRGDFDGIKEIMEKSQNIGMKTFDSALFDLYQEGMISEEEALKNSDSPNNVRLKIKFAGEDVEEEQAAVGLSLESLKADEDDGKFF